MKKVKFIVDIIGAAAMLLTLVAGALSDKADDMKMDIKIEEKVNKALAEKESKENEEES